MKTLTIDYVLYQNEILQAESRGRVPAIRMLRKAQEIICREVCPSGGTMENPLDHCDECVEIQEFIEEA